jgi:alpha-beta hydrolase superfamily lysophospholipase
MDRPTACDAFPIRTFYSFHPDANINYQLNRALFHGAEELFARTGKKIRNYEDWKVEFFAAAQERERRGDIRSAAELYRAAEFFISASDPDRRVAYEKFFNLFYEADPEAADARTSVPYDQGRMHALALRPEGASRGRIVIHAGFDAYIEAFFTLAQYLCGSGFDVVIFDGPGQGSTLMRERMPMIPDWEKPVTAVLDHFSFDDVTLIGLSLGGYLALRAAAFEPRIKRVIACDVMLDFFRCVASRRGRLAELILRFLVTMRARTLLDLVACTMMRHDLYSKWGIEQGMHVMGRSRPAEYFFDMREYNTRRISPLLTQDVLIMAGAEDHFVPLEQFYQQLRLLTKAGSVTGRIYTSAEQAQSHCQIGNFGLAAREMLTWMRACHYCCGISCGFWCSGSSCYLAAVPAA